jgi:hypothetical protein
MNERPPVQVGDQYWAWTVVAPAGKKNGRQQWLIRCSCGAERLSYAFDIRRNQSKACRSCVNMMRFNRGRLSKLRMLNLHHAESDEW